MSHSQTETGAPTEQGTLAAALRNRNLILGGLLTLVFLGAALLSFLWVPYDVTQMAIANKIKPPYAEHWLGTDHYGRDILSMLMVGARTSIAVAVLAVGIGMVIGVPLGLWAAAKRGSLLDEVIMRGNDLVFAFPSLVIAVMITAAFGPSATNAIVAIGIFNIPVFARITRSGALTLWNRDFILAARVAGKGSARISFEHILPNVLNLLIVQGTIQFSLGILAEAGLSYVGLGAQPPPLLGPDAGRQPDLHQLRAAHGPVSGPRDPADRAGPEPDGRRVARPLRSQAAEGPHMNLLDIRNLSLAIHGTPILHDVSLTLEAGRILGVIGESGSGKSMTAFSTMQLLPQGAEPTGQILLDGQDILTRTERDMCSVRGREIGMVFQEADDGAEPAETDRRPGGRNDHPARTGPPPCRDGTGCRGPAPRRTAPEKFPMSRFPHELSGGQRQRVVIAMAIALRPRLLIADEPTTALDVTTQAQILALLKKLVREEGMGLMMISHDLAVVADMADEIAIMQKGRVVETGPAETLFREMQHPYSKALLAASTHAPERGAEVAETPLLEVRKVRRSYALPAKTPFGARREIEAVKGVSFTLKRGESLGSWANRAAASPP